jgi:hypothetical protein
VLPQIGVSAQVLLYNVEIWAQEHPLISIASPVFWRLTCRATITGLYLHL